MKKLMYLMVLVTGGLVYMRSTGMLTPDGYVKFNGASIPIPGLANGAGVSSMIGAALPLAASVTGQNPGQNPGQAPAAAQRHPGMPMASTVGRSFVPGAPSAPPAPSAANLNPLTGGDPFAAVNRAMRNQ